MVNHDIYALDVLGGLLESSTTPPCSRAADMCKKIYEQTNKPSELSNHVLSARTTDDTFDKWFMENKYVIDQASRRIVLDSKGVNNQPDFSHISEEYIWQYFDMMFTSSIHRPAPYHVDDVGSIRDVFNIVLNNSSTSLSVLGVDLKVCSYLDIAKLAIIIDNDPIMGATELTSEVKDKVRTMVTTSGGSSVHLNALELVFYITECIHKMITDHYTRTISSSMNESLGDEVINLPAFSDVYYTGMSGGCRKLVDSIFEHHNLSDMSTNEVPVSYIDTIPVVDISRDTAVYEELSSYVAMFTGKSVVNTFQDTVKYRIWKDLNESFHKNISRYNYNENYNMERPVGLIHRIFDAVSEDLSGLGEIDLKSDNMKLAVAASAGDLGIDASFIYSSLKHTFGSHIDKEEMGGLFSYDAYDQNSYTTETGEDFKTDLKLVFIHSILSLIEIRDGLSFDSIQNDICRVVCNSEGSYMTEAQIIWNTSDVYNHNINESHRDVTASLARSMRPDHFDVLDTAYSYITGSWKFNEDFSFIPDNVNFSIHGKDIIDEDTDLVVFMNDMNESLPTVKRWHVGNKFSSMDSQVADIEPRLLAKVVAGISIPTTFIMEKISRMKERKQLKYLLNPKYALIFQFFEDMLERKIGSLDSESDDYISLHDIISTSGKMSNYYVRNGEVFQQANVVEWITSMDFGKYIPRKVKDFFRNIGSKMRNFAAGVSGFTGRIKNSISSKFTRAKEKYGYGDIDGSNFIKSIIDLHPKFTVMKALEYGMMESIYSDMNLIRRIDKDNEFVRLSAKDDIFSALANGIVNLIRLTIDDDGPYSEQHGHISEMVGEFLKNSSVNYFDESINFRGVNLDELEIKLKRLFSGSEYHVGNKNESVINNQSLYMNDISDITIDMSRFGDGFGYTNESVIAALAADCINRSIPESKTDHPDEFHLYESRILDVLDLNYRSGGDHSLYELAVLASDISERHRIDQMWKDRHKLTTVYTSSEHPRQYANQGHKDFDENHLAMDTLVHMFDLVATLFKTRLMLEGEDIFKAAFQKTVVILKLDSTPEYLAKIISTFSDTYMNTHQPSIEYMMDRFMDIDDVMIDRLLIQKGEGGVSALVKKNPSIAAMTFFVMLMEELDYRLDGKVSEVMEARGVIFDSWEKTLGGIKDFISNRLPFLNKIKSFASKAFGRLSRGYKKVIGAIQNKLGIFECEMSIDDAMSMLHESARTDADFELYNYLKND